MTDNFTDFIPAPDSAPVLFRVFALDEKTHRSVDEINSLGYDSLEATAVESPSEIAPLPDDRMAIFLAASPAEGLEEMLRRFRDAGVLTLLVAPEDFNVAPDCYDSLSVAAPDEMTSTVRTIADFICLNGMINLDFHDIATALCGRGHFNTCSSTRSGESRMPEAIADIMSRLGEDADIQSLILGLYFNRDSPNPLFMKEVSLIPERIKSLPENVDVVWGAYHDATLPLDAVRLSAIAAHG